MLLMFHYFASLKSVNDKPSYEMMRSLFKLKKQVQSLLKIS